MATKGKKNVAQADEKIDLPIQKKYSGEPIGKFIDRHAERANGMDLSLTKVEYPDADDFLYESAYCGVMVTDGCRPRATYSDGSMH